MGADATMSFCLAQPCFHNSCIAVGDSFGKPNAEGICFYHFYQDAYRLQKSGLADRFANCNLVCVIARQHSFLSSSVVQASDGGIAFLSPPCIPMGARLCAAS